MRAHLVGKFIQCRKVCIQTGFDGEMRSSRAQLWRTGANLWSTRLLIKRLIFDICHPRCLDIQSFGQPYSPRRHRPLSTVHRFLFFFNVQSDFTRLPNDIHHRELQATAAVESAWAAIMTQLLRGFFYCAVFDRGLNPGRELPRTASPKVL